MRTSVHNIYSETPSRSTISEARPLPELTDSDLFRFWAKVEKRGPADCWLWTSAAIPFGHGQFTLGKRPNARPYYAHRISWTLAHGSIPAGLQVCHTCDTPKCVNPAHLFLGTQLDNLRDASRKGRLSLARKSNRANKAKAIDLYRAGGLTQRQIADACGVSHITVNRWFKGVLAPYERCGSHRRSA